MIAHGVALTVVDVSDHTIRRLMVDLSPEINAFETAPSRVVNRKGSISWARYIRTKGDERKNRPRAVRFSSLAVAFLVLAAGVALDAVPGPSHVTDTRSTIHGEPRTALRPPTPWIRMCNLTCSMSVTRPARGLSRGNRRYILPSPDGTLTGLCLRRREGVRRHDHIRGPVTPAIPSKVAREHVVHRETRMDERGRMLAQVEAGSEICPRFGPPRGISYLIEHDGPAVSSLRSRGIARRTSGDLSPGYEASNLHFDRGDRATARCLFIRTGLNSSLTRSMVRGSRSSVAKRSVASGATARVLHAAATGDGLMDGLFDRQPRHLELVLRDAVRAVPPPGRPPDRSPTRPRHVRLSARPSR